jgi:hypothetical protein
MQTSESMQISLFYTINRRIMKICTVRTPALTVEDGEVHGQLMPKSVYRDV